MSTLSAATIISISTACQIILQQLAATSRWYMTQQREHYYHYAYDVDARVRRHEVRGELGDVDVECAVEAERYGERRRPC